MKKERKKKKNIGKRGIVNDETEKTERKKLRKKLSVSFSGPMFALVIAEVFSNSVCL